MTTPSPTGQDQPHNITLALARVPVIRPGDTEPRHSSGFATGSWAEIGCDCAITYRLTPRRGATIVFGRGLTELPVDLDYEALRQLAHVSRRALVEMEEARAEEAAEAEDDDQPPV